MIIRSFAPAPHDDKAGPDTPLLGVIFLQRFLVIAAIASLIIWLMQLSWTLDKWKLTPQRDRDAGAYIALGERTDDKTQSMPLSSTSPSFLGLYSHYREFVRHRTRGRDLDGPSARVDASPPLPVTSSSSSLEACDVAAASEAQFTHAPEPKEDTPRRVYRRGLLGADVRSSLVEQFRTDETSSPAVVARVAVASEAEERKAQEATAKAMRDAESEWAAQQQAAVSAYAQGVVMPAAAASPEVAAPSPPAMTAAPPSAAPERPTGQDLFAYLDESSSDDDDEGIPPTPAGRSSSQQATADPTATGYDDGAGVIPLYSSVPVMAAPAQQPAVADDTRRTPGPQGRGRQTRMSRIFRR